jgi:hypothetical protein
MNTLEKFHIYDMMRSENQINNKCTMKPNILFDTLILNNPNRGHKQRNSLFKPDHELSLRLSGVTKPSVYAKIENIWRWRPTFPQIAHSTFYKIHF